MFIITSLIRRFRPNMMDTQAADLYAYMRETSSLYAEISDASLLANLKGFIVDQSEQTPAGGDGSSCASSSPAKSSFGGRAGSFSPHKKPKIDTRPAALARASWTINIDRQARTVTITSNLTALFAF